MNQRLQSITGKLLLAFVLVSIGYALGKEAGRRSVERQTTSPQAHVQPAASVPAAASAIEGDTLLVYYFHATIRCVTCNTIERITHETLVTDFAEELADGSIQWRLENFHENEPLAERFGVATSTVVLVRVRGDRELGFRRLDRVWELVHQPGAFADYIREEVRALAQDGGG